MQPSADLLQFDRALRERAAAGDFTAAKAHWQAYVLAIQRRIQNGVCTAEEMSRLAETLEWVREVALAARAQAADRLRSCRLSSQVSRAYTETPQRRPGMLRRSL